MKLKLLHFSWKIFGEIDLKLLSEWFFFSLDFLKFSGMLWKNCIPFPVVYYLLTRYNSSHVLCLSLVCQRVVATGSTISKLTFSDVMIGNR